MAPHPTDTAASPEVSGVPTEVLYRRQETVQPPTGYRALLARNNSIRPTTSPLVRPVSATPATVLNTTAVRSPGSSKSLAAEWEQRIAPETSSTTSPTSPMASPTRPLTGHAPTRSLSISSSLFATRSDSQRVHSPPVAPLSNASPPTRSPLASAQWNENVPGGRVRGLERNGTTSHKRSMTLPSLDTVLLGGALGGVDVTGIIPEEQVSGETIISPYDGQSMKAD